MKFASAFIATVAAVTQSASAAPLADSNSTKLTSCQITEYVLALQDDCGFESIHGLWPDPEESCTNCTSEAFDESKLSSQTLSDMKKYWPTCQSGGSNEDFWDHEWSKHGTCTGMSQEEYFSTTIDLYMDHKSDCSTDCYICFTPSLSYEGSC